MKTTHILLAAVLAATSAVQAATAEHKLPAPLPEFKTPEQLAKWSDEMMAKAAAADALAAKQANAPSSASISAFYTGKPYVQETRGYAFRFRQYDPEFSRWTSPDPSGFPDWTNNYLYSNNPLNGLDRNGLIWQANTGSGASYIFQANASLNSYIGHNVTNPNPDWSGQCATGAQYATGTYDANNALHDAPKTATWQQGSAVAATSSLQSGAMIAYGWKDGGYPNANSGNHTALFQSQTASTITVVEQYVDPITDQPTGFHVTTYDISDHDWYVVTSDKKFDDEKSASVLE